MVKKSYRTSMKKIILLTFLSIVFAGNVFGKDSNTIEYGTWSPWEIDAILAAWAIKKYVHNNAEFTSHPKGTNINTDYSIDIPNSPYSRNGKTTAFQQVIEKNNINSPCIKEFITISRILEIAPWRKSQYEDAADFETEIGPHMPRTPQKGGLERSFEVIDKYCTKFSSRK